MRERTEYGPQGDPTLRTYVESGLWESGGDVCPIIPIILNQNPMIPMATVLEQDCLFVRPKDCATKKNVSVDMSVDVDSRSAYNPAPIRNMATTHAATRIR